MIVAHCIHGLGLGGAQQVIRHLVAGRSSAVRHVVYTPEDGLFRAPIEAAGASVRVIPRRWAKLDPSWAFALSRAMRADRVGLVHTHLFGDSLHGVCAARLAGGVPVLVTLHNGAAAHSRLQRLGYRWLLGRAAARIACTESARRSFLGLADGIETIANGIDPHPGDATAPAARAAARRALGVGAHTPLIGALGRCVAQKDFATLLDALARCQPQGGALPELVLLGDGPLRAGLEAQARRLGIRTRVHFAGLRDDARALLPAFDVVAISSRFEGLSMALLEAMAAARCLVATRAAGVTDALGDDQALLVPVGDAPALAAGIDRALADAPLRTRLGAAAQARFRERFTAARMVAEYERRYRQLAARPPRLAAGVTAGAAAHRQQD
ncbi:MAG: glycosyltransferase [Deltaproteobacteria bacterium]|nr:glycosyltransferase [Deltaproteobacteria bacterium]